MVTRAAVYVVVAALAVSGCTAESKRQPSARPSPSAAPVPVDLPVGRSPAVPYVAGGRYLTLDGPELALPRSNRGVTGVTPYAGGLLVADASYFEGTNGLALVRDGRRVRSWPRACSSGTPVESEEFVAWVTLHCPESEDRIVGALHRARPDGSDGVTHPIGTGIAQVVGFLGPRVVYNAGLQGGAWITDFDGTATRVPGVDRVTSVSTKTGWMTGQRGDHARSVVDAGGQVRWSVPEGELMSFSPDGALVLASTSGSTVVVLRGRDGKQVESLDLPGSAEVMETHWETRRSLLTLVHDGGQMSVVRVHLEGRVEQAAPPAPWDGGLWPFALLTPASSITPVAVRSHCGVLSVRGLRGLWLADPPLGDHNPPPGWDENRTGGFLTEFGPGTGDFLGDGGQRAHFRRAPRGSADPGAGCE